MSSATTSGTPADRPDTRPAKPGYRLGDMVDDVFRVLDGYSIPAAHVVGTSLGGMVGQYAALEDPSRALSVH